jgi:dihydropteroate synthase
LNLQIPVADWALNAGAAVINDISGLNFDAEMAETIARHAATVIVMHIKGRRKIYAVNPHYTI